MAVAASERVQPGRGSHSYLQGRVRNMPEWAACSTKLHLLSAEHWMNARRRSKDISIADYLISCSRRTAETSPINDTIYAQPVTFAIEAALAALWRSWGIEPDFVLGHSLGEYAAAYVAGMLPLGDAIRLVAERGRLTQKIANSGAMAAVLAPYEIVARGDRARVAEHSRSPPTTDRNITSSVGRGRQSKRHLHAWKGRVLRRSFSASHTPRIPALIDPVLPSFEKALETVSSSQRGSLWFRTLRACCGMDEMGDPKYWLTQMRAPVQFAKSIATLVEQGVTHFVEIGPHPVLLGMGAECIPGAAAEWLPSLRRNPQIGPICWKACKGSTSAAQMSIGLASIATIHAAEWRCQPIRFVAVVIGSMRSETGRDHYDQTHSSKWPQTIMTIEREADRGPVGVDLSNYPAKWACLERLTNAHSSAVLREAEYIYANRRALNRAGSLQKTWC